MILKALTVIGTNSVALTILVSLSVVNVLRLTKLWDCFDTYDTFFFVFQT